ncbi:hypothetical protein HG531_007493 [Fusarium graminearum]|nr:hypothetical protein HG531_007493 [Fusarium graminearum]
MYSWIFSQPSILEINFLRASANSPKKPSYHICEFESVFLGRLPVPTLTKTPTSRPGHSLTTASSRASGLGGTASAKANGACIALISTGKASAGVRGSVEGVGQRRFSTVIAFSLLDSMFLNSCLDGLFKFASLEQGRSVWDSSDSLVGLKNGAGHSNVELFASLEIKAKSAQHEGNQASRTSTNN